MSRRNIAANFLIHKWQNLGNFLVCFVPRGIFQCLPKNKIAPITIYISLYLARLLAYSDILVSFLTEFQPAIHILCGKIVTETFFFHGNASSFKRGFLADVPGYTEANWVQWILMWWAEERQGCIRYLLFCFSHSCSQIPSVSFLEFSITWVAF